MAEFERLARLTPAPPIDEIPLGTDEELEESRQAILNAPRTPLDPTGTVSLCYICGEETLVTTNNLQVTIPTPTGVKVVTRLTGAQCTTCDTMALDPAALAVLAEHEDNRIVADYETTVTTVGQMLATYLKGDLRRVLDLKGKEKLRWKVLDGDRALVEVDRGS